MSTMVNRHQGPRNPSIGAMNMSPGKRVYVPKFEFPSGSTLRFAALLLGLGVLLLWLAQRIFEAGLPVR
jgi:hypothetical protein